MDKERPIVIVSLIILLLLGLTLIVVYVSWKQPMNSVSVPPKQEPATNVAEVPTVAPEKSEAVAAPADGSILIRQKGLSVKFQAASKDKRGPKPEADPYVK